jgi:hypothetical protein
MPEANTRNPFSRVKKNIEASKMFDLSKITMENLFSIRFPNVTSTGSGGTLQVVDFNIPDDGRIYVPLGLYVRTLTSATVATRKIGYIFSGRGQNTRFYYLDEAGFGTSANPWTNCYGLFTTGALNGGVTANGYVRAGGLPLRYLAAPDDFVVVCQNDQSGDVFYDLRMDFLRSTKSIKEQSDGR